MNGRKAREKRRQQEAEAEDAYAAQPYLAKTVALQGQMRPGMLNVARVLHDDWCLKFKGGLCNCNPDVVLDNGEPRS